MTLGLFQNCTNDGVSFAERTDQQIASENNDADGDYGTGGGDYDCVTGQKLNIYLDPENSGEIKRANYLGAVVSYAGDLTAADNYNYYSASAHPVVGPTPVGFEANVFFYEDSQGIALNFFANIDAGGSTDNEVDVDIQVINNSNNDEVLLSEDGRELKEVSDSNYEGRFHYWNNTDGGVIGYLDKSSPFIIRVQFLESGDIGKARFFSANNFHFSLGQEVGDIKSFIIANEGYNSCQ